MEIFDISRSVRHGMEVYPGDPEVFLERVRTNPQVSRLDFGVHTGTHVDAPVHFIEGGRGAESLALDVLVGPCVVVRGFGIAERVLIKDAPALDEASAVRLVEGGVRLVGVDRLSVGDPGAHVALLGPGLVVVEGLDLSAVEPGPYELYCLPLKLVGSDGAPARAILIRR
ncbi:MAG TPA: cyclase family protein [Gaiellaceae bacterium]|nr:cyclase family protein [Gaiellaceae bacterium]